MIEEKLKPLQSVCRYNLNVVGGCLRDLLLNKPSEINDYDIIVSKGYINDNVMIDFAKQLNVHVNINSEEFNKIKEFRIASQKEQCRAKDIEWESINEFNLINSLKGDYYFSKVVQHLVKDFPNLNHFSARNVREQYANYHIMSINQFTGSSSKKVDLIVTDYSDMVFLTTFDVELCKAYVDLNKIDKKEDIIEKMIVTGSMLQDIENKTFSINAIKFSPENMEYFFNKHLIKLLDKFPDYQVNIRRTKPIEEFTVKEKNRWIYAHNLKMNLMFPEKQTQVKRF